MITTVAPNLATTSSMQHHGTNNANAIFSNKDARSALPQHAAAAAVVAADHLIDRLVGAPVANDGAAFAALLATADPAV